VKNYAQTRPIFNEYKAKKYNKKYLAEHEADIQLYREACKRMSDLLNGEKLPKMDTLKQKFEKLKTERSGTYSEYKEANQNFSKVARLVDERVTAVILKNNAPRYVLVDYSLFQNKAVANDMDVDVAASRILEKHLKAFEELAK